VFAALFFALHPLRVESAAWITERAHLLATSLALASVLAWLKGRESAAPGRWRIVSITLFALSLMSKAWGMTLPLVLVILDLASSREEPTRVSALRLALGQLRDKAAFFVLALSAVVIELLAKRGQVDVASLAEHGLLARAGQAGATIFSFFAKTIWPVELSPFYEFRPGIVWSGVLALSGALALSVLLFISRASHRGLFSAWLACLVLLAPVCGIAQSGLQRFADRYTYAAAMALALCVGVGLAKLVEFTAVRRAPWIGMALVVALFVGESIASARQTEYWRDSESLWRRVVALDPGSFIGWHNLATTLHRAGRKPEAAEAERASIRIEPGVRSRDARFHLGHLEWMLGERERAKQTWSEALKLDPGDLTYLDWLASTQPTAEAKESLWRLALEASPGNPAILSRLTR
jgi:tetratricopeptide (TPR) repeat protein